MTTTNWALTSNGGSGTCLNHYGSLTHPWLTDGLVNNYHVAAAPMVGNYIQISLAAAKPIKTIRFVGGGGATHEMTECRVDYSLDNANWDQLPLHTMAAADDSWVIGPTMMRYVRIYPTIGGASLWYCYEVELWEDSWSKQVPPEEELQWDLGYKLGERYAEVLKAWSLWLNLAQGDDITIAMLTVLLWNNWLLDNIDQRLANLEQGGGGGDHSTDDVYHLLEQHDADEITRFGGVGTTVEFYADRVQGLGLPTIADLEVDHLMIAPDGEGGLKDLTGHIVEIAQQVSDGLTTQITTSETNVKGKVDEAVVTIDAWTTANNVPLTAAVVLAIMTDLASTVTNAATAAVNSGTLLVGGIDQIARIIGLLGDVLEAIPDPVESDEGTPEWPGVANVTLLPEWTISHAENIPGPMDGVLVNVITAPSGQSRQAAAGSFRYKGIGWLAFMTDTNHWESVQQIGSEHGCYVPHALAQATRVAVYCKTGATLTVQPWVKK